MRSILPLQSDFGLTPVVACEIEFYLAGATVDMHAFWADVLARCAGRGIGVFNYGKEKGVGQFEVALSPATPEQAAVHINALKTILTQVAQEQGLRADFAARPFPDQPGSGLHVHVHLHDVQGKNVFYKDDTRMSDALKWSIGGLLAWMPGSMTIFAPYPASYARFTDKSNAPTTVSWGANNRTVAVRLPDAPHDNKRIEHRVAGADADPAKVITIIVEAIHWGLTHKAEPGEQIYGDASLAQYGLLKLPMSLEEAKAMGKTPPAMSA